MTTSKRQRVSAYAIVSDSSRILLCRISEELPRWEGLWTLPGGGLNFGESPEEAVVREVREETGLIVVPKSVVAIDSFRETSEEEDFHGIRIIYLVDVVGGSLKDEISGTTDCCQWHQLQSSSPAQMVGLAELGIQMARKHNLENSNSSGKS